MEATLIEFSTAQVIFIGVWAAIAMVGTLFGNYTATPLIYATGVGIILNQIETGVILGAAGQTVWLGFGISQGGVRPPEPIAPGIFATVLAISARGDNPDLISIADAGIYIGFSVPVGILMQLVTTFLFTLMSPLSTLSQKALLNGKLWKFSVYSNLTICVLAVIAFIFGIVVGFSANGLSYVANNIPSWLRQGFRVAGGMLPALGFALILKVMLKREYLGFVFLGYFLTLVFQAIATSTNTRFSVLGLAITVVGFVLIILAIAKLAGFDKKLSNLQLKAPSKVSGSTTEGEDEDGI